MHNYKIGQTNLWPNPSDSTNLFTSIYINIKMRKRKSKFFFHVIFHIKDVDAILKLHRCKNLQAGSFLLLNLDLDLLITVGQGFALNDGALTAASRVRLTEVSYLFNYT